MSRSWHQAALPVALSWLAACAVTTQTEPGPRVESEVAEDQVLPRASTRDGASATAAALARSTALSTPVAVVAIPRADARPCERMCGHVGDCLRERDDINASYLELSCLDLCVNTDERSEGGQRFRACAQSEACDPLLRCASEGWDAAAAARVEFVAQIDAAPSYDTCELLCGGMHSCMNHNQPLHRLDTMDDQLAREIQSCMTTCDPRESIIIDLAECARADTCDEQWACWADVQNF